MLAMPMGAEEIVRTFLGSFGKSATQDHQTWLSYLDDDVPFLPGTAIFRGCRP
jgi:hypothetical protein